VMPKKMNLSVSELSVYILNDGTPANTTQVKLWYLQDVNRTEVMVYSKN
jgi:hypothetical protein